MTIQGYRIVHRIARAASTNGKQNGKIDGCGANLRLTMVILRLPEDVSSFSGR
jgi:hypothetical protein